MNTEHKFTHYHSAKITFLSITPFLFFYFEIILGLIICPSPSIAKY